MSSMLWRRTIGSWGADWDYWAATAYPAWPEEDSEWLPDDSPPGEDGSQDDSKPVDKEAMVQQTWSQAHRSSQLARKDRGFGKGVSKSDGCFICGHPGHMARECPDRLAPKGKGRLNHLGYYDEEYLYAPGKGKGKFKSKKSGKSAHYMEDLHYAKGKGYGFPSDKGKSKSKGKGMVNAYTMDYFSDDLGFNVLDFQDNPTMDLQSSTKALETPVQKNQPASRSAASHGMLDSGATCSAGPETSIQNLVNSVISRDKSAKVVVCSNPPGPVPKLGSCSEVLLVLLHKFH